MRDFQEKYFLARKTCEKSSMEQMARNIELYINNKLSPFLSGDALSITLERRVDLLTTKQGEYTYPIELPRCAETNKLLGHAGDIFALDKFKNTYPAEVVVNGTLVVKGTLRLLEISELTYKCIIVSDNIDFQNKLSGKTLRDIESFEPVDFLGVETLYDHVVNKGNIDAADICFPLISYGNFYYGQQVFDDLPSYPEDTPNVEDGIKNQVLALGKQNMILGTLFFTDYPPCVWLLTIIEKIFEDIGYKVGGEIFEDQDIRRLYLLYGGDREPQWNWKYLANVTQNKNTLQYADNNGDGLQFLVRDTYTPPIAGDYVLRLSMDGQRNSDVVIPTQEIIVMTVQTVPDKLPSPYNYIYTLNPTQLDNDPQILYNYKTGAALDDPGEFSIVNVLANVSLEANQTVYLCMYGRGSFQFQVDFSKFQVTEIQNQDEFLKVEKQLPAISQLDFVMSFLKMFNIITSLQGEDTIVFERRKLFYKDISEKVDLNPYCNRQRAVETPVNVDLLSKVKYHLDEADFFFKEDPTLFAKHNQSYDENNNTELIFAPTAFRLHYLRTGNSSGVQPCVLPSVTDEEGINRDVLDPTKTTPVNYDYAPRILKYIDINNYTTPLDYKHRLFVKDFQNNVEAVPIALSTLFDRSTQIFYKVDFSNVLQVWKVAYAYNQISNLQQSFLSPAYLLQAELSLTYNENWVDIHKLKNDFYPAVYDNLSMSHIITLNASIPESILEKLTGAYLIELFYDLYYLLAVSKYDVPTGYCELTLLKKV